MELAENSDQLLGLDCVCEARVPAQVTEQHRHLAPMATEDRFVARRHDRVGQLRREETLQLPQPLQLFDLLRNTFLERLVELAQLRRLRLDRVVVPLDSQKRTDTNKKLVVVERLRNEIVGAGLDRLCLLGSDARRHHDHRQHRGVVVSTETLADGISVHLGHYNVQENEIGLLGIDELERRGAVCRRDDVVAARNKHGLEQPHVLRYVVDNEDLCRAVAIHDGSFRKYSLTVLTNSTTSTGFEM